MKNEKFAVTKEELENLFSNGNSVSKIARQYEVSYNTVKWWSDKWELTPSIFGYVIKDDKLFKKCPICEKVKEVNDINFNRRKIPSKIRNRGGFKRQSVGICRTCNAKITFNRNQQFKKKCVEYKGRKCQVCGYDKCFSSLDFHHRNPSEKDFQISEVRWKPWPIIKSELDKCDCLCRNCHAELHFLQRENSFDKG